MPLREWSGIALAVTRHTLSHDDASALPAGAGLRMISRDGAFRHRAVSSLDRDVLLAVPTDHSRLDELAALDADQETDRP